MSEDTGACPSCGFKNPYGVGGKLVCFDSFHNPVPVQTPEGEGTRFPRIDHDELERDLREHEAQPGSPIQPDPEQESTRADEIVARFSPQDARDARDLLGWELHKNGNQAARGGYEELEKALAPCRRCSGEGIIGPTPEDVCPDCRSVPIDPEQQGARAEDVAIEAMRVAWSLLIDPGDKAYGEKPPNEVAAVTALSEALTALGANPLDDAVPTNPPASEEG